MLLCQQVLFLKQFILMLVVLICISEDSLMFMKLQGKS